MEPMSTMEELAAGIVRAAHAAGTTMEDVARNLVPPKVLEGSLDEAWIGCPGCLPWGKCEVCGKDADAPERLFLAVERAYKQGLDASTIAGLRAALATLAPGTPGDGPDTAPHVRGSDTSKAAARAISTATLRGNREKLLRVILDPANTWRRGVPISAGFTDNELIRYMVDRHFWSPNAPRARRVELWRGGWLEDSGETRDGCTVWKPTEKALAWWHAQEGGAS
jgi:hypothetical protein